MNSFETFTKLFPQMTDLSLVQSAHTMAEIEAFVTFAKQNPPACLYVLPCYIPLLKEMTDQTGLALGGTVGFPSGGELTTTKVQTTAQLLSYGCHEIDMVINQGFLKSGMEQEVYEDILAVRKEAAHVPLKVILEVSRLTEEEIRTGSRLIIAAGADYVKTGTGWTGIPTTVRQIEVIRDAIDTQGKIKAAGGINSIRIAYEMYQKGCTRFGINVDKYRQILQEIEEING